MGGKQGVRYYYVESSELQKFFAKIPHYRKLKSKLSQQITDLVNAVINDKENPGKLAVIFKQLEDRYPPSIIKLFIEATKQYLNSSYFNYPGKFTTKSWLGGNFKYVSENKNNPTIKLFNDVLDGLLQEFDEKINLMSEPIQPESQNRESDSGKQVSIGPFVILAFFYSLKLVKGQEYAVNHEQDPFGIKNLSSKEAVFARLNQLHHFSSNAPSDQIRFYGFGQAHNNFTHYQILKAFIPALGNPGDLIIFEGAPAGVEFPCDQLCIIQEATTGFAIGSGNECIENLEFGMFKCYGGDYMQIVDDYFAAKVTHQRAQEKYETQIAESNKASQALEKTTELLLDLAKLVQDDPNNKSMLTKAKELNRLYSSIRKSFPALNESLHQHLSQLRQFIKNYESNSGSVSSSNGSQDMLEIVQKCLEITRVIDEFITHYETQLENELTQAQTALETFSDNHIIKARNDEGLIKTLEMPMVKNHQGSTFSVIGGAHFFPDPERPKRKPNPDESQRSIRDYLDQRPHWIGYPKR